MAPFTFVFLSALTSKRSSVTESKLSSGWRESIVAVSTSKGSAVVIGPDTSNRPDVWLQLRT